MSVKEQEPTKACQECQRQVGITKFNKRDQVCDYCDGVLRKEKTTSIQTMKKNKRCEHCLYNEHWETLEFVFKDEKVRKAQNQTAEKYLMGGEDMKERLENLSLVCQMCLLDLKRTRTRANYVKHRQSSSDFNKRKRDQLINAEKVTRKKCVHCNIEITPKNAHQFNFDASVDRTERKATLFAQKRKWAEVKPEILRADLRCANCSFRHNKHKKSKTYLEMIS